MGMDCYSRGNNPKTGEQEYFRANIWRWHPINSLMRSLGLIDEELYLGMSCNDGSGPNAEQCSAIAIGLRKYLQDNPLSSEIINKSDARVDERGTFLPPGSTGGKSAYSTSRNHLEEFVGFCENCAVLDGFEVC